MDYAQVICYGYTIILVSLEILLNLHIVRNPSLKSVLAVNRIRLLWAAFSLSNK